ncbi:MAG: CbiX/SirB N-terminal domain-containing protein [Candidatus Nanopelagicales bacterium]
MSRASRDTIALPSPPADYGVVLLSHGSPDPRARLACDLLARRVGHRLGAFVAQATLDLDRPRLDGAINYLHSKGIQDLVVVPMLLTTAYHATADVPMFAAETQASHPEARITMATPMGADPHLLHGLDAILKTAGHRRHPNTAVVLASAGSSYAAARSRHAALALEWRTHGWGASAVAFASGPGPRVGTAVADLRASGYEDVCVSPFLIAPGVMSQRIAGAARAAGAHAVTGTLHSTDAAMDVVLRRVRAAVEHRDARVGAKSVAEATR